MAAVSCQRRSSARLPHVADQQDAEMSGCDALPQGLDEIFQVGVAVIPLSGQAHHLISGPIRRQFDRAAQASGRIGADAFGAGTERCRRLDASPRIDPGVRGEGG